MTPPAKSARLAAVQIIAKLNAHGHTAYLAGGCVRDALLGNPPKDFDVATDATPDKVSELFPNSAAVGAAFGVIIVYTQAPQRCPRFVTEVATFRAEGAYSDGRRPDEVRFTDASEDASRRDFTINGLFAEPNPSKPDDPQADRVIDHVNGRADLRDRVIRAIGDPSERFGEDYLRMLRAVRFAARLGFEIEPVTSAAIRANARYLGQISRERIGQEVLAMLRGPNPSDAIKHLTRHKLDGPTLNEDAKAGDLGVSERLSDQAEAVTRLAGWIIDRHGEQAEFKPVIKRWRSALSLSNEHRDALNRLLLLVPTLREWQRWPIAKRKRTAAGADWAQSLMLFEAMGGDAASIQADTRELSRDGIGLTPAPLLTGDDLIAVGLTPGPRFKTLLDEAYDRQLEGQLGDREQALAWLDTQTR
jgi:tRNA nucleotidyltransferase/poly(A) polymerase